MMLYRKYIKRMIDFVCALSLSPFVLLLCLVVGPLIYLEDRGSVFYMAKRRGLGGSVNLEIPAPLCSRCATEKGSWTNFQSGCVCR